MDGRRSLSLSRQRQRLVGFPPPRPPGPRPHPPTMPTLPTRPRRTPAPWLRLKRPATPRQKRPATQPRLERPPTRKRPATQPRLEQPPKSKRPAKRRRLKRPPTRLSSPAAGTRRPTTATRRPPLLHLPGAPPCRAGPSRSSFPRPWLRSRAQFTPSCSTADGFTPRRRAARSARSQRATRRRPCV